MLNIKDKGIILQIKNHCERIASKVSLLTRDSLETDLDNREIICFNLFQIGELAKKLSDEFTKENNEIPWKQIKGMRDRIVHGYDTIDFDIVWNTATASINDLLLYCNRIVNM